LANKQNYNLPKKTEIIMKNLRIGFSLYGLLIVALQSFPNIIWVLFPPTINSLEGNASSMPIIEYGEHILGVSIVILLIFLVRRRQEKVIPKGRAAIAVYITIALYWFCWVLYFCTIQTLPVIYAMVVLPPVAFFCAGLAEKVYPISAVSAVFIIFHVLVALENFPISG
jgi:hypothetical protein